MAGPIGIGGGPLRRRPRPKAKRKPRAKVKKKEQTFFEAFKAGFAPTQTKRIPQRKKRR